jgi:hypothetical protein
MNLVLFLYEIIGRTVTLTAFLPSLMSYDFKDS